LLGALAFCGCGATRVSPDTQGVSVAPGPCGRGLLVVESDYQSSNVSALGFDGSVLSQSLGSSSTDSGGFGLTLSGDVALPSALQKGPQIVVIDQYPAGVLRFLDLATAKASAELSVATGFASNPYDYLPLDEHRAYVARYQRNAHPGQQDFDQGADVLIVDPSQLAITGRIDLTPALAGEAAIFSAHPAQLVQVSGRVFVLLASYSDDYLSCTASRLVELDPSSDSLARTLVLDGLCGCDGLALSPDGKELAVSCSGDDLRSPEPKLDASGIALIDIAGPPRLSKRFKAADLGSNPIGFTLAYVAPGALFFGNLGHLASTGVELVPDSLLRLDTDTAQVTEVLRSESQPFSLGGVRCALECGACFATDAERAGGSVLRFPIDAAGVLAAPTAVRAETRVGLPPRGLGVF
jgi:hypothetical protein